MEEKSNTYRAVVGNQKARGLGVDEYNIKMDPHR
jgi:hypothetical protein